MLHCIRVFEIGDCAINTLTYVHTEKLCIAHTHQVHCVCESSEQVG